MRTTLIENLNADLSLSLSDDENYSMGDICSKVAISSDPGTKKVRLQSIREGLVKEFSARFKKEELELQDSTPLKDIWPSSSRTRKVKREIENSIGVKLPKLPISIETFFLGLLALLVMLFLIFVAFGIINLPTTLVWLLLFLIPVMLYSTFLLHGRKSYFFPPNYTFCHLVWEIFGLNFSNQDATLKSEEEAKAIVYSIVSRETGVDIADLTDDTRLDEIC